MKKEKKEKENELIDSSFTNKFGKTVKVSKVISEKEFWALENKRKGTKIWIISNKGIQKIAEEAGISKNYKVEESENIIPKPENSLLHVVRVTIKCNAKEKIMVNGCIHDENDGTLEMTGEASKLNTRRGGDYLRLMAEKRGYDRAVLRHLGIEGAYSEEESVDFENDEDGKKKVDVLEPADLEAIAEHINQITGCKSKEDLKKVGEFIKDSISKLNENQLEFLRQQYQKTYSTFVKEF